MSNSEEKKPRNKWRLFVEVLIESLVVVFSLYILAYSTVRYLAAWFNSNFADNYSLFVSLGLVLVSMSLPLLTFWLKKRFGHPLAQEKVPSEIRKQEYPKWKKEARLIKLRRGDLLYGTLISAPPIYLGYVLILFSQWLLGYLASHQYLNFVLDLAPWAQGLTVLFLFALIASILTIAPMSTALMGTLYLVRRYLNYPKDEDFIFAECILIAECLSRNDRSGAHKEVRNFLSSLTLFSRNWFNSKRKVYSQEMSILRKNKMALCRMVRFSEDYVSNQIGELFVSFGLSLRKGDDPTSFRNMNSLIENLRQYEPVGRWRRLTSNIERYPTMVNLINLVVYVSVIALALAAFALGYPAISHLLRG